MTTENFDRCESFGLLKIDDFDSSNVPVNIRLLFEDEEDKWVLTATCYQPRRACLLTGDQGWVFHADHKEYLLEIVKEKMLPLYKTAFHELKRTGELYYWMNTED